NPVALAGFVDPPWCRVGLRSRWRGLQLLQDRPLVVGWAATAGVLKGSVSSAMVDQRLDHIGNYPGKLQKSKTKRRQLYRAIFSYRKSFGSVGTAKVSECCAKSIDRRTAPLTPAPRKLERAKNGCYRNCYRTR